jgi:adenylate cyclase
MPHRRERILVADDEEAIRELWAEMLTHDGYQVVTARHGGEALELLPTVVPNLIILDLCMPEMSGSAFLRVLEGVPLLRGIPVLIISGFLEDEPPHAALGLNIVGRLSKPLRHAELLAAVQAALALAMPPIP